MDFLAKLSFIESYESVLASVANFIIITLEFIGILVIVVGTIRGIVLNFPAVFGKKSNQHNIRIDLAQAFSLGLVFKMGAEIIKTVVVKEISELWILGLIIIIHAALFFLIHFEIKVEKQTMLNNDKKEENNE